MSKQFVYTTDERRSSVIYSTSAGKGGLLIPQDYIPSSSRDTVIDELSDENIDVETGEGPGYESLLDANNSRTLQREAEQQSYGTLENEFMEASPISRRNSVSKRLVDEERDLLIDNKLLDEETHNNQGSSSSEEEQIFARAHENEDEVTEVLDTWETVLDSGKTISTTYKREIQVITYNALPLIFTFILQNSLSLASIFSVSHLGTKELGAVTLGSMTANIMGLAAIQGLCTCLDTLCSQAYGAKNYRLVGILVQRCAVITILAFLPVMYIWWSWSEFLLSAMIPEKELCYLASRYLRITALGVPGFILFECGKRFLQCQGIFHASTIVLFVCAPLNAIMNYLFVWDKRIGIGYLGAPLSVAINYWLMAFGLLLYTVSTNHETNPLKCWNGIIKKHQVFKNWRKMFNLALPGIIMVEAEFLGFEILTIFASHINTASLGAQSIVATVASFAYQVPFSISVCTSTRVANLVGASLYKSCIITCKVSLLLSFVCSSINMFIIFNFKRQIAALFSNEEEVKLLVVSALSILAIMELFDAFNASTAGCLRGQGRQKIGGYINLFAFYCIGIPMAYLLTFVFKMGINGLWTGITCALMMMSICQGYAVFHGDWEKILLAAKLRNSETAGHR
ncbi:hypothetical protein KAFR_0J00540 [Kazachstania africana CBS 2517]|uniref:Uncharacterized protein n=1 Tax=Kazachstania africana (strain ATCC 22294 / BCRC 22015 / CBS 2517 / CECT 1963 / NBRC 1671 / NRRL Y-8276) TaxID=1071382 RepID=H2B0H2_KAZAF|nr:hypothetical protein KAFR_0J00540 [Kazachstania africana CBS 2517]CCF60122.1 hypothetical protein KAFR_0J00540 [Kazachstania africana CBS 2517]